MDPAGSDDGWVMGRVGRVTAIGSACIAGYDAAGDMTCRAPSSATTCSGTWTGAQLTYDNAGRLAAWQNAPSNPTSTTANLYDGAGHRVEQQVTTGLPGAPVTTTTVYVGNVEEVATSGSTTTTTTYYYAGGARIALAINGVVSYLASDALGSLSLALAASGAVEAAQLFDPYGNVRYSTGTMPGSYGFAGQHADSTTGLDYFNARYYDPAAGQFVTADTTLSGGGMDPWALARYAYVEGNPLIRLDPSGHDWFGSLVSSVAHVVQAAAPAAIAVLDATTGIPSMIGDVHTIFFSNASPLDKVMAGADLLLNVGMDAAMVVGVGEGLRVAYVGVHVAEHMAEDVGAHAIEHAGEDAVAHTVEHEAESEAEHATEQAVEDGAEAGGCLSFAAGTLVATPTGETPIAALKAGDHVTAYDPATGTASTQTVTATSIHHDDNLVDLTLRVSGPATPAAVSSATASRTTPATPATPATAGKAASQATAATSQNTVSGTHHEVIHTTTNHPWLTGDHGWLPASFLRVGEPVVQLDGTTATVATIHVVPGAASMWDLTVSNLHTFAVGTGKYIVHNNMCPVKSRIHEDPELVKHAERAGSDPKVQRDMDNLIRRYREGNPNPGLENGSLFKDVRYLRARSGARVFFRMAGDTMEVLGKASKANETRVIRIMQMMYGR